MSTKRLNELQKQLKQLEGEHEDLEEDFYRAQEDGEATDDIEFQLASIEVLMGELEIELEILR
jgi:hypothetical protein